jgi:Uma2 family endonuclease
MPMQNVGFLNDVLLITRGNNMITTPPPRVWRMNRSEYERLGELGLFDAKRVQLIEGQVIEMSPMGTPHSTSLALCIQFAGRTVRPGAHLRCQQPLALDDLNEVEPDIAIISGDVRAYLEHQPTTAEFVIEVADSSMKLDCEVKSALYAKAGVQEYWVVDLKRRCLEIFRNPNVAKGEYESHRIENETQSVGSVYNPTVLITVADLLP